jgi:hypothetical protein
LTDLRLQRPQAPS